MGVSTDLLRQQDAAVESAYAAGLGVPGDAFTRGEITVVERPEGHWGFTAVGASFVGGTVLCVHPELVDVARSIDPTEHREALSLPNLDRLAEAAAELDLGARVYPPSIGWALARRRDVPSLPAGLRVELVDRDWLNERIPEGWFPNGAGEADGSAGRSFRNLYGVALLEDGEPVALAGAFATYGMHEIGVDVLPAHQGRGLGAAAVAAAVAEILRQEAVPFYGCSPTNIRSQRTALSVGFVPVCADATIA